MKSAYKYWNDVKIEQMKPFFLNDVNDRKLIDYLESQSNIRKCFEDALANNKVSSCLKGKVLDVGAGVGWSSALLSKFNNITNVVATDYSKHRLEKIAPIVFEQFQGDIDKLETQVGDFFELEWKPNSFNVIVFVQALYMFEDMDRVLRKVQELLVPGGVLIVACERLVPEFSENPFAIANLKRWLRWLLKGRSDISGNYGRVDSEYKNSITKAGLNYHFQLLKYPLTPSTTIMAGNHFGFKER